MKAQPKPKRELYRIDVHVQSLEEYCDYDDPDSRRDDRDDFLARTHARIIVSHALVDPDAGHTAQQIHDSFLWSAGVIARVTLQVQYRMAQRAQGDAHGCWPEWKWGELQGHRFLVQVSQYCRQIADSELHSPWPVQYPPYVWLEVIHADAKGWVKVIRERLADIIATDQQPAPEPQPEQHPVPPLSQNPTPATQERTR